MKDKIIHYDEGCRLCNSNKISEVFKLKPTPPEDLFLPKGKLKLSSTSYPLTLAMCENCGYVHLPHLLDPSISYKDYIYESNITVGLSQHYKEYANSIISFSGVESQNFVIDLGSNDGTMLQAFKDSGMKILGVEPSENIAGIANRNGLETIVNYFNKELANEIIKTYGKPMIVTANYMYANIDNVVEFTKNVASMLNDDGIYVIQTGYHPEQMKINMFDYIYHEHFSYFSVKVLSQLLCKCGMDLISVSLHPAKGGSIRVVAQHKGGKRKKDNSIKHFLQKEERDNIHDAKTYIRFAENINQKKIEVLDLLNKIKESGKRLVGYGASHSTTTLLHHFEIGEYLEYLVDDNPAKHDLYSPGYHLPVYSSDKLYADKPDYALVLAWQHNDSIINNNKKYLNDGGRFIVPLPQLRIV